MPPDLLQRTFLDNTVESYLWCIGILLIGLLFKEFISRIFSRLIFKIFHRFSSGVTDQQFHHLLKKPFSFFFLLIIIYIAFSFLQFPPSWNIAPEDRIGLRMILHKVYHAIIVVTVSWMFIRLVDFLGLVLSHRATLTESRLDDQLIPFFKDALKILLIILSFFLILATVFNVNIVTLIGGLGIGGLAVALAAKETLENLLGSFTIFLDKPFIVGDNVKVGAVAGHVETIGLRSTRIRTYEKSLVTVPNKKMVDAELENITQRTFWRARIVINLLHTTTAKDARNIFEELRNYLVNHPKLRPDATVNFDNIVPGALEILIVYFVRTTNGDEFQQVKEEINFRIMEIVRNNNSDFSLPASSIYIERKPPNSSAT
jgi:MscS family membrane protein